MRTWNLSSVWRLPTTDGPAWLKVVPPFFAHEGAVIDRLAGGPVPILLGRDGRRILMADIPGDDRYDATGAELLRMIDGLVAIQAAWAGRIDELLALGVPDWRGPVLSVLIADVVARTADQLIGRRARDPGRLRRQACRRGWPRSTAAACPIRSCTATSPPATSAAMARPRP